MYPAERRTRPSIVAYLQVTLLSQPGGQHEGHEEHETDEASEDGRPVAEPAEDDQGRAQLHEDHLQHVNDPTGIILVSIDLTLTGIGSSMARQPRSIPSAAIPLMDP